MEAALRKALHDLRTSEEALRRSERELKDFVENAAEGLQWVGPDGNRAVGGRGRHAAPAGRVKAQSCRRAARRSLGYTPVPAPLRFNLSQAGER